MEQIRIIKEMREHDRSNKGADEPVRPRWMVWENVPGALSSGANYKGEDFRIVLEETARIVEKDAVIPGPPKEGWHNSGVIMGDGYSMAWRITDAQWWGVPQRRRRICLLADLNGHSAPDTLFDSMYGGEAENACSDKASADTGRYGAGQVFSLTEGMSGNTESCRAAGENTPGDTGKSTQITGGGVNADPLCRPSLSFQERAGKPGGAKEYCFNGSIQEPSHPTIISSYSDRGWWSVIEMTSTKNLITVDGICPTLTARMGTGGNQVHAVFYGGSVLQVEE